MAGKRRQPTKEQKRRWVVDNREQSNNYSKTYRARHRDKIKKINKNYHDTHKDRQRELVYKRKYGITLVEYDLMFAAQNGACAICLNTIDKPLDVDHDHVSGKVRSLLCNPCNAGLGHFSDDESKVIAAFEYLCKHKNSLIGNQLFLF